MPNPLDVKAASIVESPIVSSHDVVLAITDVHRTASDIAAFPEDIERRNRANHALERAIILFRAHCAQEAREQYRKLAPRLRAP